jgi:hypothetical protein
MPSFASGDDDGERTDVSDRSKLIAGAESAKRATVPPAQEEVRTFASAASPPAEGSVPAPVPVPEPPRATTQMSIDPPPAYIEPRPRPFPLWAIILLTTLVTSAIFIAILVWWLFYR